MDFPELTIGGPLLGQGQRDGGAGTPSQSARGHSAHRANTSASRALLKCLRSSATRYPGQRIGISAGLVGQPYETLIQEYLNLPAQGNVKEKWLYRTRRDYLVSPDAGSAALRSWRCSGTAAAQRIMTVKQPVHITWRAPNLLDADSSGTLRGSWLSSSPRPSPVSSPAVCSLTCATVIKIGRQQWLVPGAAAQPLPVKMRLFPVGNRGKFCVRRCARSEAGTMVCNGCSRY